MAPAQPSAPIHDVCLKDVAACPQCGAELDHVLKTIDYQMGAVTLTFVHEDESSHRLSGESPLMARLFERLTEPLTPAIE